MDHTPDEEIEDSWSRWEYPVMRALARWEQTNESSNIIRRAEVVELVHADAADTWKVGRALDRLADDGLILVNRASDGTPWRMFGRALTTNGGDKATDSVAKVIAEMAAKGAGL